MPGNYHNLSEELQKRIQNDRKNGYVNPCSFKNEAVIRRNMERDKQNLWRPSFVRDIEKIMHVPYYNRYSDKTQVFSLYKNDDITRRALHVQFVSRIARNIGVALGLNVDLIEAISLGHDIGHTPFGHAGERKLNDLYNARTGRFFNHNIHSARVLDDICDRNISLQTLDGIICHNGEMELGEYRPVYYDSFDIFDEKMSDCYNRKKAVRELIPSTLEGCVMRVSDIIAYIGKDRQDAQRLGIISDANNFASDTIGSTNAEIINNMIVNIIENSYGKDYIKMDSEYFNAFSKAKSENSDIIYRSEDNERLYDDTIGPMMEAIYNELVRQATNMDRNSVFYTHHIAYIDELRKYAHCRKLYLDNTVDDMVVDYIAGMTDDYMVDLYDYLFPNGKYKVQYKGYFE